MSGLKEEVAATLLRLWDPLRIAEVDVEPEQEYLFEAGEILEILAEGSDVERVANYLLSAERDLGPTTSHARDLAARQVVILYEELTRGD